MSNTNIQLLMDWQNVPGFDNFDGARHYAWFVTAPTIELITFATNLNPSLRKEATQQEIEQGLRYSAEEDRMAMESIESANDKCRLCGAAISSCELCADCAEGNDASLSSKYSENARGPF